MEYMTAAFSAAISFCPTISAIKNIQDNDSNNYHCDLDNKMTANLIIIISIKILNNKTKYILLMFTYGLKVVT
jgi:hypothetical protein